MSEKAGLIPREVAWRAILSWKEGEGFLAENVHRIGKDLESRDRSIALDLSLGVCRNVSLLEWNLQRFLKRMPEKPLQWLLLTGIYQLYATKKFPSHVAVDVTVEIAKLHFSPKEAGMVNGVLRSIIREGIKVPRHSKKLKDVATAYSHPGWMIHRWNEEIGFNKTIRRLRANNEEPTIWYRLNPSKCSQEEIEASFTIKEWRFDRFFQVEEKGTEVLKSGFLAEGKISVQDPSSWLLTRLLDLKGDEKVLDLCAAPGGKSALLLEEFPLLDLVASELKWPRLKKMDDLQRLGRVPERVQCDGLQSAFKKASFSHVLLDAPCSNLGVIGRRPEARWLSGVNEILAQAKLQKELLAKSACLVAPGGVLVYGTCSPEPEETLEVIEEFLEENPEFSLSSAKKWIHRNYCYKGCLQIIPQPGSLDGFFGARLERSV